MSRKTPYIFFYARTYEKPNVALAGWQAFLIWPHVLALLKVNGSVLSPGMWDAEYLSLQWRVPVEIVQAGMDGIVKRGLLVEGSRTVAGGPGGKHEKHGLVAPGWDVWQRDQRPTSARRRTPTAKTRTPPVPQDNGGKTGPNGVGNGQLELEQELELNKQHQQRAREDVDQITVLGLYNGLGGRGLVVPSLTAGWLLDIVDANSAEVVREAADAASGASSPLRYFRAMFDDKGKRKADRRRKQRPGVVEPPDAPSVVLPDKYMRGLVSHAVRDTVKGWPDDVKRDWLAMCDSGTHPGIAYVTIFDAREASA